MALNDAVYVLATYTAGNLSGTFLSAPADPVGYTLTYAYEGNKIALVSGGGPTGFAAWQSANSTGGALDADHDGDGVDNGTEYFLGGNANTTGFTALPGVTNTAGTLSVTWNKAATVRRYLHHRLRGGNLGHAPLVAWTTAVSRRTWRTRWRSPVNTREIHLPLRHEEIRPPQGHRAVIQPRQSPSSSTPTLRPGGSRPGPDLF